MARKASGADQVASARELMRTAKRMRSGIGNDSTHCLTGTRAPTRFRNTCPRACRTPVRRCTAAIVAGGLVYG